MADDRTSEFLALARSLPASSNTQIPKPPPPSAGTANKNTSSVAQLKDFHTTAAGISRDIASTSALLGELTQLVKQKSLFQDDTPKVNALVVRIKSSIENLNRRLEEAGRAQKRIAKSQAGQEASNVVGQLQEEFGVAAQDFKKVLQERTDTLKETSDRKRQIYGQTVDEGQQQQQFSLENKPPVYGMEEIPNLNIGGGMGAPSGFPTLDLTSGMTTGEPTGSGSQLPRPHGVAYGDSGMRLRRGASDPISGNSLSSYYGRQDSTPLTPFDIQRMEQESGQDQMMQLIPDQDYLRERADAMEQVESNIVELGTIFNKLAVMVNEHRDMVQRVEDNVDDANMNIGLSLNTLTDTLTNLQTNRALALKVFSILVAFIIMFIVFFA